jgi:hypothetical protein
VGFKCEKRPPGVPAVWETNFTVQPSPVASPNPGGITGYQPTTSISIITSGDVWGAEQQGFCLPGIYLNFPLVMVWQGLYVFLSFILLPATLSAQTDSRYDAGKNLPFNEKAGEVNPQTGNITLGATDFTLPGRAGMDFSFGRIWALNQSNVFSMYRNDLGVNGLSSRTIEAQNHMGVGWLTTLLYIYFDDSPGELVMTLFFGGNAYELDQGGLGTENLKKSDILGYDLLDLKTIQGQEKQGRRVLPPAEKNQGIFIFIRCLHYTTLFLRHIGTHIIAHAFFSFKKGYPVSCKWISARRSFSVRLNAAWSIPGVSQYEQSMDRKKENNIKFLLEKKINIIGLNIIEIYLEFLEKIKKK